MHQRIVWLFRIFSVQNVIKIDPKLSIFKNSSYYIDEIMVAGLRASTQSFFHKNLTDFDCSMDLRLRLISNSNKPVALVTLAPRRHIINQHTLGD
jgi:hypothetical protein